MSDIPDSGLQQIIDALASPVRREILWRIWDEELTAGAIAAIFTVTPPTVSEHLAVLRAAGLVQMRPQANRRYFRAVRHRVRGVQAALMDEGTKWVPIDDPPPAETATARTALAVLASVDLPHSPTDVFTGFTDSTAYSSWLGVPVSLTDGRFACTLEWGTQVRGTYEHVLAPSLIALRWDFDDDRVPLPAGDLVTYLRFDPAPQGCRVQVHQLVDTQEQARFMQVAWTFVLGRLELGLGEALAGRPGADAPKGRTTRP